MKKIYTLVALVIGSITTMSAQWTGVTTPTILKSEAMTNSGNKLFITTADGVYSTTDEGQTWDTLNNGIPVMAGYIFSKSLALQDGDLYLGTSFSTLYKSTDEGQNWTEAHANLFIGGSPDHVFLFKNSVVMISAFAESGGLAYSTNNGQTWTLSTINGGGNKTTSRSIVEINGTLFAVTLGGVITSIDNGVSWDLITGGGLPGFGGLAGTLFESNNNLIMSLYGTGTYLSTDMGVNWTQISGPNGEQLAYMTCIEGNDNIVFMAGPTGYYQSNNNGLTWISITDNITSQVTYSMRLVGTTLFLNDLAGTHKREINVQSSTLTEKTAELFELYPNPAISIINIEVNKASAYKIVNLLGSVVKEGSLMKGKNELIVDEIAKGNYFLKVENEVKQISIN